MVPSLLVSVKGELSCAQFVMMRAGRKRLVFGPHSVQQLSHFSLIIDNSGISQHLTVDLDIGAQEGSYMIGNGIHQGSAY